ncbi:MAG: ATP-dependent zinc metalloprotease FtsH [Alphaproteobacteria bacterium]
MEKKTEFHLWYFVVAFAAILLFQAWWQQSQTVETIPYSQFQVLVSGGNVGEVKVSPSRITGTFSSPEDGKTRFVTTRVEPDPNLLATLRDSGVVFTGTSDSNLVRDILSWILPIAVFFGIWMFMFRRIADRQGLGGLTTIGKSKAKVYVEKETSVSFKDVAGVDEAKGELEEIVSFLRTPDDYGRLGARIPKGILLVGPPGTGKTLLARAVAGEAGVPFFSISGSEFIEMFVGVGAARVRDLFEQARQSAPAIIFIDELDALGRARGAVNIGGGHDEREQTLNQLLSELDGFDPSQGVVLLAATNRPEILDPALLRAGRFDRQILVDRPDKIGREQILRVHIKKIRLDADIALEEVAELTTGFTGADLANLVNEAALLATRRRAEVVSLEDFTAAIERIVAGLEKKNRLLNPKEKEIVAHHEMGHALVALSLPTTDKIHKVSIIPRGIGALGYTIQRPTEDRYLMTRDELADKVSVLLGGRAAEQIVFGKLSTGASDDLAKATDIARSMATRYGMDETLGNVAYETDRTTFLGTSERQTYFERQFSEETAREIDEAVKAILDGAYAGARDILERNRALLESCAARLMEKETLSETDLAALTQGLVARETERRLANG